MLIKGNRLTYVQFQMYPLTAHSVSVKWEWETIDIKHIVDIYVNWIKPKFPLVVYILTPPICLHQIGGVRICTTSGNLGLIQFT